MKNQRIVWYVLLNLCLLTLVTSTGPRLRRELILEGLAPGASVQTVRVTQKAHSVRKTLWGDRAHYWVSWTSEDIRKAGVHRLELSKERWEAARLSEPVMLVYAGSDPEPSLKGDPAGRKRLARESALAALEAGIVALALANLLRRRKRT